MTAVIAAVVIAALLVLVAAAVRGAKRISSSGKELDE
jgi:hypothetical protein